MFQTDVMLNSSLKASRERFVTGLNGTTLLEINLASSLSPVCILLRALVWSIIPTCFRTKILTRFFLDYIILILPFVFIMTQLSDQIANLLVVVLVMNLSALLFFSTGNGYNEHEVKIHGAYIASSSNKTLIDSDEDKSIDDVKSLSFRKKTTNRGDECRSLDDVLVVPSKMPFMTAFRVYVNIASCICILAVDFKAFPRRFGKTENFGSSIMDVGVGAFILSNALVSTPAKLHSKQSDAIHWEKYNQRQIYSLLFQLISSWPLVVLGAIRLLAVKLSGYQEHITEYGVHWNFFFSLSTVRILAAIILYFVDAKRCLLISVCLACFYQTLLSVPCCGLTDILLNVERGSGLIMQNREGIASCLGYLALYFCGIELGSLLFKTRTNLKQWSYVALQLMITTLVLWFLLSTCSRHIQPISRRMANLAYILWVLSYSTYLLFLYLVVDIIIVYYMSVGYISVDSMPNCWLMLSKKTDNVTVDIGIPSSNCCLLSAINRNQLFYFLFCNILTGAVNFSMDTLSIDCNLSFCIICIYTVISAMLVWGLHVKNISLKFW